MLIDWPLQAESILQVQSDRRTKNDVIGQKNMIPVSFRSYRDEKHVYSA